MLCGKGGAAWCVAPATVPCFSVAERRNICVSFFLRVVVAVPWVATVPGMNMSMVPSTLSHPLNNVQISMDSSAQNLYTWCVGVAADGGTCRSFCCFERACCCPNRVTLPALPILFPACVVSRACCGVVFCHRLEAGWSLNVTWLLQQHGVLAGHVLCRAVLSYLSASTCLPVLCAGAVNDATGVL